MRNKFKNIAPIFLLIILAIMPLVLGIGYAASYSFGLTGVLNNGFTFIHWQTAFADDEVVLSFVYSILLSLVSMVLSVGGAAFLTLYIGNKMQKGKFSYIIYLPMAFPALVAAFFFFQFLSSGGFLSRVFFQLGFIHNINDFPNLVNDRYSFGILATQFFLSVPIFIVLNLSILKNENISALKTLAASLGAKRLQIIFTVTLPILLKKSFPSIVLFFIFKLGTYEIPLLLGRSSPEVISVITLRKMQRYNLLDIPQGYVIAVLYALLVFILLAVSLKPTKINMHV